MSDIKFRLTPEAITAADDEYPTLYMLGYELSLVGVPDGRPLLGGELYQ